MSIHSSFEKLYSNVIIMKERYEDISTKSPWNIIRSVSKFTQRKCRFEKKKNKKKNGNLLYIQYDLKKFTKRF